MTVGYFRFPTISGNRVVFVSEDDLWNVAANGGTAHRLTSNLGAVSYPTLSPDGSQLAFIGREEGASEVYLMAAQGGSARRLTFLGSDAQVAGWTPDGTSILFASTYGQPAGHPMALFSIAADCQNGTVSPLGYGDARSISFGPNGSKVIGRAPGREAAHWKRYRGGTAGRLWIDRNGNNQFEPFLRAVQGNISSPMWITDAAPAQARKGKGKRASSSASSGHIFFVSDHEGVGNLYSCTVDGDSLRRHTDHEDFYVRNPASDGQRIVYHAGADLYLFDIASDQSQAITIEYHSPRVQRNRKFVDTTRFWESYSIHPHGRAVAIVSRGKLFGLYNHEGPVGQLGQRDGVRYRLPEWFNDANRLFVISDELGEECIEIRTNTPDDCVIRLPGLDIGRALGAKMSPTADKIAITNHRHELLLVDLSALDTVSATTTVEDLQKRLTVVDRSPHRLIAGFDWSPDGCWLTYGFATSQQVTEIRLYALPDSAITEKKNGTTNGGNTHLPSPNPVAITHPVLQDTTPAFDPDGKYIYFLSSREFNPVSDGLHFEYGFPWGQRPYLVVLRNDLPNPFVPRPDLEEDDPHNSGRNGKNGNANGQGGVAPTTAPVPEPEPEPEPEDSDDSQRDGTSQPTELTDKPAKIANHDTIAQPGSPLPAPPPAAEASNGQPSSRRIRIDLDGISQRIVPFPVPDGRYGRVLGIPGRVYFTSFEIHGALDDGISWEEDDHAVQGTLRSFNFKDYRSENLVDGVATFALSRNRKKLFYSTGRKLRVFSAGEKPPHEAGNSRRTGWIDLSRIKVSIEPQSEWQQMMREAWRLQRDHFWNAEMSEVDWQAVFDRYYPLIERVSSRSEFGDLLLEMQGELGTSHAFEGGGDKRFPPYYRQGFLAASFSWDANAGGYRVDEIVEGEPSTGETTSPLLAPAADVRVGDLLLTVNGQRLDAETSPAQLLVNYAGNEVLLTLAGRAQKSTTPSPAVSTSSLASSSLAAPTRYAVVKTLHSEGSARYRAWVNSNRQRIHTATGGKIGYVHIPDMGMVGYAEFHRGYLAEVARNGLIVDVRYNSGGHVSSLILEKLARRRIGGSLSRWSGMLPYPDESVAGPLVTLINEHTASDGDIFAHGFKLLKLGPLIGKRTWGGVIGFIRRHHLVDGTSTTQPEFSHWFEDIGWELENLGAIPDIEVDFTPQDALAGRDPQIERAIAEALHLLEQQTPTQPDLATRPSRALPKLPPRLR